MTHTQTPDQVFSLEPKYGHLLKTMCNADREINQKFGINIHKLLYIGASQLVLVVKNLPANAGDARDTILIPGSEDLLQKEVATHSSILAWRTHGQRSLVGYSPVGSQRVRYDLATKQQQPSSQHRAHTQQPLARSGPLGKPPELVLHIQNTTQWDKKIFEPIGCP